MLDAVRWRDCAPLMVKSLEVTQLHPRDYRLVMQFIRSQSQVHYHLDWEPISDWLRGPLSRVGLAWQGGRLAGVMALSPGHHGHLWMRLLALPPAQRLETFEHLWGYLQQAPDVGHMSVMTNQPWLQDTLDHAPDFTHVETVINLQRDNNAPLGANTPLVTLRQAMQRDLEQIIALDHAAFGPMWQLRLSDLQQAHRRASLHTVALDDAGAIIGHQLSMRYGNASHLARLAVLPAWQGYGIAQALLNDLIQSTRAAGIDTLSVNTQLSNHRSQRLYQRLYFERDYNDMRVYSYVAP